MLPTYEVTVGKQGEVGDEDRDRDEEEEKAQQHKSNREVELKKEGESLRRTPGSLRYPVRLRYSQAAVYA